MRYDSDDELDRALFALQLEEPPEDLRPAILAATVYRPALPVKLWELWTLGAVVAAMVWLCIFVASGHADPAIAATGSWAGIVWSGVTQPNTLMWLALGGGVTVWLSLFGATLVPAPRRLHRR